MPRKAASRSYYSSSLLTRFWPPNLIQFAKCFNFGAVSSSEVSAFERPARPYTPAWTRSVAVIVHLSCNLFENFLKILTWFTRVTRQSLAVESERRRQGAKRTPGRGPFCVELPMRRTTASTTRCDSEFSINFSISCRHAGCQFRADTLTVGVGEG